MTASSGLGRIWATEFGSPAEFGNSPPAEADGYESPIHHQRIEKPRFFGPQFSEPSGPRFWRRLRKFRSQRKRRLLDFLTSNENLVRAR
jgi:hypothetical protein